MYVEETQQHSNQHQHHRTPASDRRNGHRHTENTIYCAPAFGNAKVTSPRRLTLKLHRALACSIYADDCQLLPTQRLRRRRAQLRTVNSENLSGETGIAKSWAYCGHSCSLCCCWAVILCCCGMRHASYAAGWHTMVPSHHGAAPHPPRVVTSDDVHARMCTHRLDSTLRLPYVSKPGARPAAGLGRRRAPPRHTFVQG